VSFSVVRSLPEDEWRRFVEQNPAGNIFHTPEMHRVFGAARGYKPEVWAVRGSNQQVSALFLPVRISLNSGILRRVTSRDVAFGSILCTPGSEGVQGLKVLLQAYQDSARQQTLFSEMRNIAPLDEYQPSLSEAGFKYAEHLNYLIDLTRTSEEVFKRIGKRTQRNLKRGINLKRVNIEEVTSREGLRTVYSILHKTYRAAQVPLADLTLFEAAFDRLHPQGMLRLSLARVGDAPAAASVELLYKDTIYGWYGGTDRDYGMHMPNDLLMWHILKWGSEQGYRVYDFGGAGTPGEAYGVRDFKAKFGGKLVNFGRNTWVPNKALLKVSEFGYSIYRRFL